MAACDDFQSNHFPIWMPRRRALDLLVANRRTKLAPRAEAEQFLGFVAGIDEAWQANMVEKDGELIRQVSVGWRLLLR